MAAVHNVINYSIPRPVHPVLYTQKQSITDEVAMGRRGRVLLVTRVMVTIIVSTSCLCVKCIVSSGVLNAADYYGLDELRAACAGFAETGGGITVDTACALLASAERYIHYKCTKSLVQKVRGRRDLK